MPEALQLEVDEGGRRLDKILAERLPEFTRSRIQKLMETGCVEVDGRVVPRSYKARAGEKVVIRVPEVKPSVLEPEDLNLDIRYRDEHIAVVNKPAGMVVHPSRGHDRSTLVHGLMHAFDRLPVLGGEERPGIVHRLDKGTSGLMVVACTDQAHLHLQKQFADHSAGRHYLALALGVPDLEAGCIRSSLGRDPKDRFRFRSVEEGGKEAVTHWRVEERLAPRKKGKLNTHWVSAIRCRLETGRTHQVRVHLLEQNLPILGDPLYRSRTQPPQWLHAMLSEIDHQLLHARRLELSHPVSGERMVFEVPPPPDFQQVLEALRSLY